MFACTVRNSHHSCKLGKLAESVASCWNIGAHQMPTTPMDVAP